VVSEQRGAVCMDCRFKNSEERDAKHVIAPLAGGLRRHLCWGDHHA